jgi:L-2,4-diaminobutyric acid acetyltransferase
VCLRAHFRFTKGFTKEIAKVKRFLTAIFLTSDMTIIPTTGAITLRIPVAADGSALHDLIRRCPPLDENSVYCNLLQCTHFAGTSVAAEAQGKLAGFISGYLVPAKADTLFVWQVAIDPAFRGQGLATRMLNEILERPACAEVTRLETTITESNRASWSLFEGLARKLQAELKSTLLFDKSAHFNGKHESERLVQIGPIS